MKKEDVKVGMKVRVIDGDFYGRIAKVCTYIEGSDAVVLSDGDENIITSIEYLFPLDPLECLEEGGILYDEEDEEYAKVLSKIGGSGKTTCYVISGWSEDARGKNLDTYGIIMTAFELKERGFKPYHPEAEETKVEEMTLSQVCKELGREIKITKE